MLHRFVTTAVTIHTVTHCAQPYILLMVFLYGEYAWQDWKSFDLTKRTIHTLIAWIVVRAHPQRTFRIFQQGIYHRCYAFCKMSALSVIHIIQAITIGTNPHTTITAFLQSLDTMRTYNILLCAFCA